MHAPRRMLVTRVLATVSITARSITALSIAALSIATLSLASPAAAEPAPHPVGEWQPAGEWLKILHLEERAWVANEHRVWAANSLVVEMRDGSLVLCDTPSHAAATHELLDWVEARFDRRVDVAIVSHYHADAAGGIAVLAAAGIPVHGSAATAKWMASDGEALKQQIIENFADDTAIQRAFAETEFTAPTHLIPDGENLVLSFGDEKVHIIDPGPAHAIDNIATHFPSLDLLFGGCMIKSGRTIGYTGDADIPHWPEALRTLIALEPKTVIPGHGHRYFSPNLLEHTIHVVEHHMKTAGGPSGP